MKIAARAIPTSWVRCCKAGFRQPDQIYFSSARAQRRRRCSIRSGERMDQIPKALRACASRSEPHHVQCRGIAVGATGRPRRHSRLPRHRDGTDADCFDYVVICLPMSILSGLDCQLSPKTMAGVRARPGRATQRQDGAGDEAPGFWEEDDHESPRRSPILRTC